MNQAQVQRRINEFQRRFNTYGDAAMHLAYHAALPVALNPDLIHLLRINFFLDPPERLPYSIEFEFLLSSLCRQVDEGLYEIEPDIRAELLEGLSAEYDAERIEEIATLLWQYVDHYAPWEHRVGLERAQQLTALNFLDIEKAQQWLDEAENKTRLGASAEREWFLVMRAAVEKAGVVKDQARTQKSENPSSARPIMLPSLPEHYVDRPEIITSIKQGLLGTGNTKNHNKIFIVGQGGIGKTTIAIAVANSPEVQARFPDGILWASLIQRNDIEQSLLTWLQSLGKVEGELESVMSMSEQIRVLLKNRKILLVVDNVEDDKELELFDVGSPMCKMLVTTRSGSFHDGSMFALDTMKPSQAMSLLERKVGAEFIDEKRSQVSALAKSLGYVPLALVMAGEQMKKGHPVETIFDSIQDEISLIESQSELWTILFLSSNPAGSASLRLTEEMRDIEEGFRRERRRVPFSLEQRWALRFRDLQRALLDVKPQIVHFLGYGAGESGLMIEDRSGNTQPLSHDALENLFRIFSDQIWCVVLNGCYSESQANAISNGIPYVIGLDKAIGEHSATEFLVSFYSALGAGGSINDAFQFGCNGILSAGFDERMLPVLITQPTVHLESLPEEDLSILRISEPQQKQLCKVILSEYRSLADIERLVAFGFNINWSEISHSRTLEGYVFDLVRWAERSGRLEELFRSLHEFSTSPETKRFYTRFLPINNDDLDKSIFEPISILLSYAHKDEEWKEELEVHLSTLKRQGAITLWQDRVIAHSLEWDAEIRAQLEAAHIILLLVSPRFMASEYIYSQELMRAMERHEAGTARVIPIMLKPVYFEGTPLAKLQVLPKNAKPITRWDDPDEAFVDVVKGISTVIKLFQKNISLNH